MQKPKSIKESLDALAHWTKAFSDQVDRSVPSIQELLKGDVRPDEDLESRQAMDIELQAVEKKFDELKSALSSVREHLHG